MPTFIFNGGAGGGGGGGGGPSPSPSPGPVGIVQNNSQGANSGQRSMLHTRRERMHIKFDVKNYNMKTGQIKIATTSRIPRQVVSMAYFYHGGVAPNNIFGFTIDVLLVPISFNMKTCSDLYVDIPDAPGGMRGLRDNIILLRRIATHGPHFGVAGEQWDVPEDVQNQMDYQLVVACPAMYRLLTGNATASLDLLLEMVF